MTRTVDGARYEVRRATLADLPALVAMPADDVIGATERPGLTASHVGTKLPLGRAAADMGAARRVTMGITGRAAVQCWGASCGVVQVEPDQLSVLP